MAPPPPHHTTPERVTPPEHGQGRRPTPRPAFNPLLLSSAFYTGPTAYGGAAAATLSRPRRVISRLSGSHDTSNSMNISMSMSMSNSVRPVDSGPTPPISRTAKRIMDLLEEYSSPISDAKRVPRPVNPPLAVRPKPYSHPGSAASSTSSASLSSPAGKYRALQLSSSATLLKLRSPRPTHSAIAASLSSCRPLTPSTPSPAPSPSGYSLPPPDAKTYRNKVRRGAELTEECGREDAPRLPDVRLQLSGKDIVIDPFPRPPLRETPAEPDTPRLPPSKRFRFREPLDLPTYRKTVTVEDVPARVPVKCWNGDRAPAPLVNGDVGSGKSHSLRPEKKSDFAAIVAEQAKMWECDSCMTRNGTDKERCVCCEAAKPGAPAPSRGSSLADIVKKQSAQWKCPDCFTGNDPAAKTCPCCGASNPAEKKSAAPADPKLSGILDKQKKMWECSSCLTRNDRDHSKCVCCEAPMPGSEPAAPPAALGFNFGSTTSSFKFGIDKANDPVETPKDASKKDLPEKKLDFSFGTASTEKKEEAVPTGGFKFGASPAAVSKLPTFSFGEKPKEKESVPASTEPPKFTFGLPNNSDRSVPPKSEAKESADKPEPPKATFTFGSPLQVAKPIIPVVSSPLVSNAEKEATSVTVTTSANVAPSFSLPVPAESKISSPSTATSSAAAATKLFAFGNKPTETFQFAGSSPVSASNSLWNSSSQNGSKLFEAKSTTFGDSVKSSAEPATTFGGVINSSPKLPSFTDSAAKLPSFGDSIAPKLPSFGDSAAPKLPSFGDSAAPKLPSFGDSAAPKLPSFGDSAAPKLPSFGDSTAPKLPSLGNPPSFSSPSLFPSLPNTNTQTTTEKPSTGMSNTAPGLFQFGEKPKESHGFPAPVFSFSAQPTTTAAAVSTTNSNIFSGPASTNSMFNLNSVTKTDAPTVPTFGAPSTNLFNSKPSTTDSSKPTSNMFGNTALPANPFSSPTGPLFGSSVTSPSQTSTNLFATNTTKTPVFGSPAVTNASQPGQSAPQFGAPSFGSNLIFGQQNAQPGTTGTPGNALSDKHPGESTNNLFNINHSSQSTPMTNIFGNLPGSAASNNNTPVFGSSPAVPTPVFGASIPFGESSQVQSNASAPFKFGATNPTPSVPNAGFGQAPAAGSSAPVFSFGSSAVPPSNSQFNFNMGAPSSAFPSTPGQTSYPPRRFKKAVRRTVMR